MRAARDWQADFAQNMQLMKAQKYAEARNLFEKTRTAEPEQPVIKYSPAAACVQNGGVFQAGALLPPKKNGRITPAGCTPPEDLVRKNPELPVAAPLPGLADKLCRRTVNGGNVR